MNKLGEFIQKYRGTVWGDLLYRAVKYSPVAYYAFLSLYCLVIVVVGKETIPSIAILPFVYSYAIPLVIVLIIPVINFFAFLFYWKWMFIKSSYQYLLVAFYSLIVLGFMLFGLGLGQLLRQPLFVHPMDIALIVISLWDLIIRAFFSTQKMTRESDYVAEWLGQLGAIGFVSLYIQARITMILAAIGYLFQELFHLHEIQFGMLVLSLVYATHAFLRWCEVSEQLGEPIIKRLRDSMVSPSYRRRTQESARFLRQRLSKLGIEEKSEGMDDPLQNSSILESIDRDDQG